MRLLLMVALLLAWQGMIPFVLAQPPDGQHQAEAGHGVHRRTEHRESRSDSNVVAHVCPGCAVLDTPDSIDVAVSQAPRPRLPADPAAPPSFHSHPVPPPPRQA